MVTLWEDVPSAQSLSRHKKLHNDLTKPGDICKKGIPVFPNGSIFEGLGPERDFLSKLGP